MIYKKRVVIDLEIDTETEEQANAIVDAIGKAVDADEFCMPIIVETIEANQFPETHVVASVFRQTFYPL